MRENRDFVVPVNILTTFAHAPFSWAARHTTVCLDGKNFKNDYLEFVYLSLGNSTIAVIKNFAINLSPQPILGFQLATFFTLYFLHGDCKKIFQLSCF